VHRLRLSSVAALAVLVLASACDQRVTTPPLFEPQVIILPNEFSLQASSLDKVTDERVYTWQSDGTAATVNQVPSGLTGTVSLFVLDGAGNQVYQHALTDTGTFTTSTGTAGSWSVRVHLEDATGGFAFQLKKPAP
jgi:hypothetical protein